RHRQQSAAVVGGGGRAPLGDRRVEGRQDRLHGQRVVERRVGDRRGEPAGSDEDPGGRRALGRGVGRALRRYFVTQGLYCSSFCSRAATVSASRRVLNVPIRTRYTDGVPSDGVW